MTHDTVDLDAVLADIWREALTIPAVRESDDFFDLGGNSLQAIQIVSRIKDTLAIEVPVSLLDRASTFAEFAAAVEAERRARPAAAARP